MGLSTYLFRWPGQLPVLPGFIFIGLAVPAMVGGVAVVEMLLGALVGGRGPIVSPGVGIGLAVGFHFALDVCWWYNIMQRPMRRRLARKKLLPPSSNFERFFLLVSNDPVTGLSGRQQRRLGVAGRSGLGLLRRVEGGGELRFSHGLLQEHLLQSPDATLSGFLKPSTTMPQK